MNPWSGVGDRSANSKVWAVSNSFTFCIAAIEVFAQEFALLSLVFCTSRFPVTNTKIIVAQTDNILPMVESVFHPLKAVG